MKYSFVKVVIYVPEKYADKIRDVLAKTGCGHIGNYDYCSFSVNGFGRFRPLKKANPFVGKIGKIEKAKEERIETICPSKKIKGVLRAIKKVHPYEEPAIDVYPLLDPFQ